MGDQIEEDGMIKKFSLHFIAYKLQLQLNWRH